MTSNKQSILSICTLAAEEPPGERLVGATEEVPVNRRWWLTINKKDSMSSMFHGEDDEGYFEDGLLSAKRVSIDPPSSCKSPSKPLPPQGAIIPQEEELALVLPPHEEITRLPMLPLPGANIHQQGWLPLLHPPYEEIIVTGVPTLPPPGAIIHQQGGDPLFPASGTKVAAEKSFQPATKKESPKKKWKWLAGAAKGKYKDYRKKQAKKAGKQETT